MIASTLLVPSFIETSVALRLIPQKLNSDQFCATRLIVWSF